jgi:hypothetical protein
MIEGVEYLNPFKMELLGKEQSMLKASDEAPDFSLPSDSGANVSLKRMFTSDLLS